MRAALSGDSIGYSVQAPVEELRAMEQSATAAGRRLLLVGGEAAALLFAFAVLAARSMRRDLEAARRRLTWYGARRWQLRLLTVTESAIVAVAGALIGWIAGVIVGALAASRAGAPVGAVLRESVLSPAGLAIAAGVVVLATLVVAVATSMPARAESRFGLLDVAAVGSIALVIAALLGGAADQSRLAESQNAGLVLLLLPGLIAFAAAVAAARLFGPLVRLAGRLLHRSVGARLAAVTLGRGPGAAAVTVAFLTLAFALALLAEGYRATLVQAESDQARQEEQHQTGVLTLCQPRLVGGAAEQRSDDEGDRANRGDVPAGRSCNRRGPAWSTNNRRRPGVASTTTPPTGR